MSERLLNALAGDDDPWEGWYTPKPDPYGEEVADLQRQQLANVLATKDPATERGTRLWRWIQALAEMPPLFKRSPPPNELGSRLDLATDRLSGMLGGAAKGTADWLDAAGRASRGENTPGRGFAGTGVEPDAAAAPLGLAAMAPRGAFGAASASRGSAALGWEPLGDRRPFPPSEPRTYPRHYDWEAQHPEKAAAYKAKDEAAYQLESIAKAAWRDGTAGIDWPTAQAYARATRPDLAQAYDAASNKVSPNFGKVAPIIRGEFDDITDGKALPLLADSSRSSLPGALANALGERNRLSPDDAARMRAEMKANPEHADMIRASYLGEEVLGAYDTPTISAAPTGSRGGFGGFDGAMPGPVLPLPDSLPGGIGGGRGGNPRGLTPDQVVEVNRLRATGVGAAQIVRDLGLDMAPEALRVFLHRGGTYSGAPQIPADRRAVYERVLELSKQGKSYSEIAAELGGGHTKGTVAGLLYRIRQASEINADNKTASLPGLLANAGEQGKPQLRLVPQNGVALSENLVAPELRGESFNYILFKDGAPFGTVRGRVDGDKAHLSWLGSALEGPNTLGVAGVRQLREAMRRDYPEVTTFEGVRTTGSRRGNAAREDSDRKQSVRIDEWMLAPVAGSALTNALAGDEQ